MSAQQTSLFTSANLLNYWKMDDVSGTSVTDTISRDTLTATNASIVGNTDGKFTNCIAPTGTNYVDRVSNSRQSINGAWSLSFWIKTSSTADSFQYIGNRNSTGTNDAGWFTRFINGAISFYTADNTGAGFYTSHATGLSGLNDGEWHHVVFAGAGLSAGSAYSFYKDGTNTGNFNLSRAIVYAGTPRFTLGRFTSTYNGYFDDVMMFNKKLSGTEVTELYNSPPDTGYKNIKLLVVAGGGGGGTGGSSVGGAGGGAGGYKYSEIYSVTRGRYTVTVGAGGGQSTSGENSVFNDITATGGGYGAGHIVPNGVSGGSGGGSSGSNTTAGSGTSPQGNNGSIGAGTRGSTPCSGGGGGGAGGAGAAGANSGVGGAGGAGISNSITGSAVTYAVGGAGNQAGSEATASGVANTGNGGKGAQGAGGQTAGSGGSGVVIVSYPTGSLSASGGTVTTSGGNTIHTFTSSGFFTVGANNFFLFL